MAQIPVYSADLQMGSPGLSQKLDLNVASSQSEALSRTAGAAMNLAGQLIDIEKARKKAIDHAEEQNFANKMQQIHDDALNNVTLTGKSDGVGWVQQAEKFYDTAYNKELQSVSDVEKMQRLQVVGGRIRNSLREKTYVLQTKQTQHFAALSDIENVQSLEQRVLKDPSQFDDAWKKLQGDIATNPLTSPSAKTDAWIKGRAVLTRTAIEAYLVANDYEEATRFAREHFSNLDPTEAKSIMEKIKNSEINYMKLMNYKDAKDRERGEREKKEEQSNQFHAMMQELIQIDQSPAGEKVKTIESLVNKYDMAAANGDISFTQRDILKGHATKEIIAKEHEMSAINFFGRLTTDNLADGRLERDVMLSMQNKELSFSTFTSLMTAIRSEVGKQKKEGKTDEVAKAMVRYIKDMRPHDPTGGYMRVGDAQYINRMLVDFWKERARNPKGDAEALGRAIIKRNSPKGALIHQKYWQLINQENPEQAIRATKYLLDKKQIDPAQALEIMTQQNDKIKLRKLEQAAKVNPNGK